MEHRIRCASLLLLSSLGLCTGLARSVASYVDAEVLNLESELSSLLAEGPMHSPSPSPSVSDCDLGRKFDTCISDADCCGQSLCITKDRILPEDFVVVNKETQMKEKVRCAVEGPGCCVATTIDDDDRDYNYRNLPFPDSWHWPWSDEEHIKGSSMATENRVKAYYGKASKKRNLGQELEEEAKSFSKAGSSAPKHKYPLSNFQMGQYVKAADGGKWHAAGQKSGPQDLFM